VTSGARAAVTRPRDRFRAWMANHRRVLGETLVGFRRDWGTSLMTWLVLGIALVLPLFLYLLLMNAASISGGFEGKPRISLYLDSGYSAQSGKALAQRLADGNPAELVVYISPEEALAEFQSRSGFGDVLNSLPSNPLPGLIEVTPSDIEPGALRRRASEYESLPGVSMVVMDVAWIERLFALLSLGERLVVALSLVLAVGMLLVIGNTIRLAIENRRAEIEVVKLVGGTDGFVRRPFLYMGLGYGLGGALTAWLLVQISLWFLRGPVELLAQSYQNAYSLQGLGVIETLGVFVASGLLGIIGAALAVSKHLREMDS
jgi:cell division transport system permease protein